MKPISLEAQKVFDVLLQKMKAQDCAGLTINNSPGVYMGVNFGFSHEIEYGPVYYVNHTYEQNSDLMRDPEIMFFVAKTTGRVYPISFQQDNLGIYREYFF